MQIVIDIPEKYLNSNIIDVTLITGANNTITDVNVEDKYAEFQILPKGHGDLIDRSALREELIENEWINGIDSGGLENIIDEATAVIEADK